MFTVQAFSHPTDQSELRYGVIRANHDNNHPVIFIPGLGGSVKVALEFLEPLAKAGFGPIFALDARGFGLNESIAPKLTPKSYIADFEAFYAHLQQSGQIAESQKPLCLSISLGSTLALQIIHKTPTRFSGQIQLAPAYAIHPKRFSLGYKLKQYAKLLALGPFSWTTLPYGIKELTQNPLRYDDPKYKDPLRLPTYYLLLVEQLCHQAKQIASQVTLPTFMVIPGNEQVCCPETMHRMYELLPAQEKMKLCEPHLYHDIVQEPPALTENIILQLMHWRNRINPSVYLPEHALPAV